tara:strand:- start:908 stop:1126 length:219 start_codon:yes stop_codon:yes gene_type:complete
MQFNQVKEFFTFAVAVTMCIAGTIFWVQNMGETRIEELKEDIAEIKLDIKEIQENNREIIRIMGRLEGLIDK